MILTYDAIDGQGHEKNDIIEATNPVEAAEMLRARGLYVTRITEQKNPMARAAQKEIPKSKLKLPLKTVGIFTRQMAMLLNAGSSVVPAVAAIKRQMRKPAQVQLLASVVHDVEEGATLTEALRKFPQTFDSVYCAIIAAGEASGTLGEMFERLARIVGSRRNMRNKIIGALIYPALLIVMSAKIMMVLLFFVLPRFGDMFRQLDVQPPAMTQILLNLGTTLREHWYWVLLVALMLLGGIIWALTSRSGRQFLSDIQLSIPMFGPLRSRMIQAQAFRTLGTLLDSKVGLLEALELARDATNNRRFQKLFDLLEDRVTSGGQPSTAFEESGLVEPYINQAVKTGEDTGNMGTALTYCADILDEGNTEMVNTLTRLIEPAILIVMGLLVGGVAVSLFLPLFDLTSAAR